MITPGTAVIRHWCAWATECDCDTEFSSERMLQFEAWLAEVKAEQDKATTDRIIALLHAENDRMSHGDDYYNAPMDYAITLIEGENNER